MNNSSILVFFLYLMMYFTFYSCNEEADLEKESNNIITINFSEIRWTYDEQNRVVVYALIKGTYDDFDELVLDYGFCTECETSSELRFASETHIDKGYFQTTFEIQDLSAIENLRPFVETKNEAVLTNSRRHKITDRLSLLGGESDLTQISVPKFFVTLKEMNQPPFLGRREAVATNNSRYGFVGLGHNDDSEERFSDFWRYDLSSETWTQLPDYPLNVSSPFVLTLSDSEILIGGGVISNLGARHNDFTNRVELFDINEGRWYQMPFLPQGRAGSVAVADKESIYLLGGTIVDSLSLRVSYTSTLETNVPINSQTEWVESYFPISHTAGVGIKHNEINVAGGGTDNEFVFRQLDGIWKMLAPIPTKQHIDMVAFTKDERLFMGFGFELDSDNNVLSNKLLFRFDENSEKWEQVGMRNAQNLHLEEAVTFSIGNRVFIGTGGSYFLKSYSSKFYEILIE